PSRGAPEASQQRSRMARLPSLADAPLFPDEQRVPGCSPSYTRKGGTSESAVALGIKPTIGPGAGLMNVPAESPPDSLGSARRETIAQFYQSSADACRTIGHSRCLYASGSIAWNGNQCA